MELSILLSKLEDIDDDFSPIWATTALQHAAEISPLVTERTIGPDLAPFANEDAENVENDKLQNSTKAAVKSKTQMETTATPLIELQLNSSTLSVSSLQNLDLQTIVNSVRLREAETERRRKIRKGVLELQEKYNVVVCRRSVEQQQEMQVAHEQLLAKTEKHEEIIRVKAELQVEQELNVVGTQLDEMLKKTQRQLQSIFFHSIVQYQRRFRAHYESLIKLLMSHEAKVEHNAKMKQLIQMFDQLINKIKGSECGIAELQVADKLCRALESLEQYVHDEMIQAEGQQQQQQILEQQQQQQQQQQMLEKQQQQILEKQQHQQELQQQLKQEEQQQQQLKQEEQQQQQQQQLQQQQQQQEEQQQQLQQQSSVIETEQVQQTTQTHVSEERLKFYTHITTFYQEKVERVKPLQADEAYKKFRFACQKAINIPVNAISGVNAQHLRDKFEKLYGLLAGQVVKNADAQFSINEHPLGRDYCLLLMAKKFVSQGDTAISSNPQAAFPVASIIVSLWKSVPDFGKIFLAYIFKESPFMVPYFIAQSPGQTLDEYYKVLGYRSADNKPEPQDMYLKRQAGITRLYAAVMITNSAVQLNVAPHPYGVEHAWRWLVNLVMLDPLPDICATILQEMLQIVGSELWRVYGKQFVKLLLYVQQQYFPRLSAVDEGGPKARLELLLNKYLQEGQIPSPQGLLPANFW